MKLINRFLISLLLVIMYVLPAKTQMVVIGSESWLDKLRLNKVLNGIETASYSDLDGDPYLFKDFAKGKLYVTSGEELEVNVRYDIYADEMHLKNDNQIYAIIHPERIKLIKVENESFIYSKYSKSPGGELAKNGSYFILKTDGKCKLLVKKNIRVQDAEPPKLYQPPIRAKFILTNDTYYLKLDDANAVSVSNKKALLSVLSEKKDEINKFITNGKLSLKKVVDLEKIVSYYNGL